MPTAQQALDAGPVAGARSAMALERLQALAEPQTGSARGRSDGGRSSACGGWSTSQPAISAASWFASSQAAAREVGSRRRASQHCDDHGERATCRCIRKLAACPHAIHADFTTQGSSSAPVAASCARTPRWIQHEDEDQGVGTVSNSSRSEVRTRPLRRRGRRESHPPAPTVPRRPRTDLGPPIRAAQAIWVRFPKIFHGHAHAPREPRVDIPNILPFPQVERAARQAQLALASAIQHIFYHIARSPALQMDSLVINKNPNPTHHR